MKRGVLIFDLDGTLVDSMPDLRAALNEMLGAMHQRELTPGEVRRMIGDGTRALLLLQTRAAGSDTDAQERAMTAIRRAFAQAASGAPTARLVMTGPGVFSA